MYQDRSKKFVQIIIIYTNFWPGNTKVCINNNYLYKLLGSGSRLSRKKIATQDDSDDDSHVRDDSDRKSLSDNKLYTAVFRN